MDTGEEPPPSGAQPQQGGQQPQEGAAGQQGGSPAAQPQARAVSQAPTIKTQPRLGAAKILLDTGEPLPSAPQPSDQQPQQGGGFLRARPPSGAPFDAQPLLSASSPSGQQQAQGGDRQGSSPTGGQQEEEEKRRLEEMARRGRQVRVAFNTAFSYTETETGCPTPQKQTVRAVYEMAERRAGELMRQHPWLYRDMALDIAYAELADKGVIRLEELKGGGQRVSLQAPLRYKTVLLARGGKMVELPEDWGKWDERRRAEWLRQKLGELGSDEAAFAVVSEDAFGGVKVEQVFVQPEGPLGGEAPVWAGVAGVPADLDALKRVRPNLVTVARGQLEEYLSPPKVAYAVRAVSADGREVALEAPLTREQFEAELRRRSPGAVFQLAGVWVQAPSGSPSGEELDRLYGEFLAAWAARQGYRRVKAGGETVEVPENLGTEKAPVGGSALFLKPAVRTGQTAGASLGATVTEQKPVATWLPPELRSFEDFKRQVYGRLGWQPEEGKPEARPWYEQLAAGASAALGAAWQAATAVGGRILTQPWSIFAPQTWVELGRETAEAAEGAAERYREMLDRGKAVDELAAKLYAVKLAQAARSAGLSSVVGSDGKPVELPDLKQLKDLETVLTYELHKAAGREPPEDVQRAYREVVYRGKSPAEAFLRGVAAGTVLGFVPGVEIPGAPTLLGEAVERAEGFLRDPLGAAANFLREVGDQRRWLQSQIELAKRISGKDPLQAFVEEWNRPEALEALYLAGQAVGMAGGSLATGKLTEKLVETFQKARPIGDILKEVKEKEGLGAGAAPSAPRYQGMTLQEALEAYKREAALKEAAEEAAKEAAPTLKGAVTGAQPEALAEAERFSKMAVEALRRGAEAGGREKSFVKILSTGEEAVLTPTEAERIAKHLAGKPLGWWRELDLPWAEKAKLFLFAKLGPERYLGFAQALEGAARKLGLLEEKIPKDVEVRAVYESEYLQEPGKPLPEGLRKLERSAAEIEVVSLQDAPKELLEKLKEAAKGKPFGVLPVTVRTERGPETYYILYAREGAKVLGLAAVDDATLSYLVEAARGEGRSLLETALLSPLSKEEAGELVNQLVRGLAAKKEELALPRTVFGFEGKGTVDLREVELLLKMSGGGGGGAGVGGAAGGAGGGGSLLQRLSELWSRIAPRIGRETARDAAKTVGTTALQPPAAATGAAAGSAAVQTGGQALVTLPKALLQSVAPLLPTVEAATGTAAGSATAALSALSQLAQRPERAAVSGVLQLPSLGAVPFIGEVGGGGMLLSLFAGLTPVEVVVEKGEAVARAVGPAAKEAEEVARRILEAVSAAVGAKPRGFIAGASRGGSAVLAEERESLLSPAILQGEKRTVWSVVRTKGGDAPVVAEVSGGGAAAHAAVPAGDRVLPVAVKVSGKAAVASVAEPPAAALGRVADRLEELERQLLAGAAPSWYLLSAAVPPAVEELRSALPAATGTPAARSIGRAIAILERLASSQAPAGVAAFDLRDAATELRRAARLLGGGAAPLGEAELEAAWDALRQLAAVFGASPVALLVRRADGGVEYYVYERGALRRAAREEVERALAELGAPVQVFTLEAGAPLVEVEELGGGLELGGRLPEQHRIVGGYLEVGGRLLPAAGAVGPTGGELVVELPEEGGYVHVKVRGGEAEADALLLVEPAQQVVGLARAVLEEVAKRVGARPAGFRILRASRLGEGYGVVAEPDEEVKRKVRGKVPRAPEPLRGVFVPVELDAEGGPAKGFWLIFVPPESLEGVGLERVEVGPLAGFKVDTGVVVVPAVTRIAAPAVALVQLSRILAVETPKPEPGAPPVKLAFLLPPLPPPLPKPEVGWQAAPEREEGVQRERIRI
jgi:hypothetical protein